MNTFKYGILLRHGTVVLKYIEAWLPLGPHALYVLALKVMLLTHNSDVLTVSFGIHCCLSQKAIIFIVWLTWNSRSNRRNDVSQVVL